MMGEGMSQQRIVKNTQKVWYSSHTLTHH